MLLIIIGMSPQSNGFVAFARILAKSELTITSLTYLLFKFLGDLNINMYHIIVLKILRNRYYFNLIFQFKKN